MLRYTHKYNYKKIPTVIDKISAPLGIYFSTLATCLTLAKGFTNHTNTVPVAGDTNVRKIISK